MPMGVVSDSEFLKEKDALIDRASNPTPKFEILEPVKDNKSGRRQNDTQVPDTLRKLIGITAIGEGRQSALALAKEFDISSSSVDAYTAGKTSSASESPDSSIKSAIDKTKIRIRNKSKKVLYLALNALTEEKINAAKAVEISAIAKNMSTIMDNMEPKSNSSNEGNNTGPTFVFYKPEIKNESEFGIVHSRE